MFEILNYEFMQNALYAALLASIACGIIGTFVVVKRIVFISGGIAHAAFGGIGLGYFLGISPLLGVVPFSLAAALGIGLLSKKSKVALDTSIGIFWAVGMAIGVILIGLTPGYAPDLFSYLFGNILTVPKTDLALMLGLNLFIIVVITALYKEFLAVSFDEEFATISNLKTTLIFLLLLCLVAVTVVMLIRIVGIILVIALLTLPAAIAKQWTKNILTMMILAIFISIFLTVTGLVLAYILNFASGATIIIVGALMFILSWRIKNMSIMSASLRDL